MGHQDADANTEGSDSRSRWPVAHDVLGLTAVEARTIAHAHGWTVRDLTSARFAFSDYRAYRVNIWLGEHGRVVRAEFY